MALKNTIQQILVKLGMQKAPQQPPLQADLLSKMARSLEKTEEIEYSCNETYALLDQFAEMISRGEDAASMMPLVQKHLEMCPDCREEFEALLHILESEQV